MIILDLDNCVSDDSHRIDILATKPRNDAVWDAYHGRCLLDKPANKAVWENRSDIIILTGRPNDYFLHTKAWCEMHGLKFYWIIMRHVGNVQSASELKKHWASYLLKTSGVHIDIAYDDRPDIIDAYKQLGIKAEILKAHDREWV